MEPWRAKAFEMLPELETEAREAETPMGLWIEIGLRFEDAYAEPRDDSLIWRIYEYAFWCLDQPERDRRAEWDLPTCVVVCFYESIPTIPAALRDMPRWFTRHEVLSMREVFTYLWSGDFEDLLALFEPPRSNRRRRHSRRP